MTSTSKRTRSLTHHYQSGITTSRMHKHHHRPHAVTQSCLSKQNETEQTIPGPHNSIIAIVRCLKYIVLSKRNMLANSTVQPSTHRRTIRQNMHFSTSNLHRTTAYPIAISLPHCWWTEDLLANEGGRGKGPLSNIDKQGMVGQLQHP